MVKSPSERDFERSFRKPPLRRCMICKSTEPYGADGRQHRFLDVGGGKYVCNYCNNQGIGR